MEDGQKVFDFNGKLLPITIREAVRCKAVVDHIGLINIIKSKWKLELTSGESKAERLRRTAYFVFFGYVLLVLYGTHRCAPYYDRGYSNCMVSQMVINREGENHWIVTGNGTVEKYNATLHNDTTRIAAGGSFDTLQYPEFADDQCEEIRDSNISFLTKGFFVF